ncbi:hypothetical protein [uncultured Draconibacterium sp.]|uniref:hypothetical protein n=1 Tax=uncultured Draconibacterium sp. TaxID=1573823 RepID=UPI003216333A
MKKLVLLFVAVFITAISANVFAQNSGTEPSPGSIHDYWVNSSDDGASHDHDGNSYTWWISMDENDLADVETNDGTYFTINSGNYNSETLNDYKLNITWTAASADTTLYLVVAEMDGTSTCINKKAIAIQPQSHFVLKFVALEGDETSDSTNNYTQCAPDITLSAAGTTISYDYGSGTYMFKLIAQDIYTDWSFVNTLTDGFGAAVDTTSQFKVGNSGTWTNITDPVSVNANPAGTEEVYVRTVVNFNTEEGLTDQTLTLTLTDIKDVNDTAVSDVIDADDVSFVGGAIQTQTITARPSTSGIGSN